MKIVHLAIAVSLAVACRAEAPEEHADADAHAPDEHEHEPAHGELPRVVELAPDVIAAMGIRSEPARREVLAPTLRFIGEVQADPDRTADVPARVAGTLASISVREGDRVKAGQTIAIIRAPGLGALRSAKTSLQARLVAADATVERLGKLNEQRLAANAEVEAARAQAESLRAELRAASEQLRALEVGRGKSPDRLGFAVMAPRSGIVVRRTAVVGEPVNEGSVLASIVDLEEAWFAARVFEHDLARVQVGAAAEVRLDAFEDLALPGTVEAIAQIVDPGARTLTARIRLRDPEGRLRLGLFGTAEVVASAAPEGPVDRTPTLVVPRTAIIEIEDTPVVFVRHPDDHFEVHDIVLGRTAPGLVEVVHGLHEGEQVVVDGAFNLKSVLMRQTLHDDEH